MLGKYQRLVLLGFSALWLTQANAEVSTSTIRNSANALLNTQDGLDASAQEWNLNKQEWQRYQGLMQGSRGIYSPGLDPLTALGIEARSDEERRHYAELQVQAEAQRTAKELAYQQAYDEAWKRLYPNLLPIQPSGSSSSTNAARGSGRLAVFIKADCTDCTQRIKALQARGQEFDVYMVGSQGDDARIRSWAIQANIDPTSVRSRKITLNHDAGRWLSLGLGGELPAVVREVNGQWLRQ
jgi:integrating conjugative element protein (TIGR03759 family)